MICIIIFISYRILKCVVIQMSAQIFSLSKFRSEIVAMIYLILHPLLILYVFTYEIMAGFTVYSLKIELCISS